MPSVKWRALPLACGLLASCAATGPTPLATTTTTTLPPSSSATVTRIDEFTWRNSTPTQACFNPLTGSDAVAIRCSATTRASVRITVTNVLGDCRSSSLLYGTRCTTIEGVGTATGNWEAPWQPGSTDTAMTVTATCEVLDERGSVLDSRTTCIPSLGWVDGHAIIPPWTEACQAQLQGCHRFPY